MDNNDVNNREGYLYLLGARGYSAYEVAVQNGFVGTEEEWLASLKGDKGDTGNIFDDLTPEQKAEIKGDTGKSAYEISVEHGFVGTEQDWVNSFLTPDGYVKKSEIIDELTSTDANKPLSAKQGKVLDEKIDATEASLAHDIHTIDYNMDFKLNSSDAENTYVPKTTFTSAIANLASEIEDVASGSPIPVSSVGEMSDTTKIYVNTSDGKWYYYDGDSWEIGGIYQATESSDTVNQLVSDHKRINPFFTFYQNVTWAYYNQTNRAFEPKTQHDRMTDKQVHYADEDLVLNVKTGYRFAVGYCNSLDASDFNTITNFITEAYTIPKGSYWFVVVAKLDNTAFDSLDEVLNVYENSFNYNNYYDLLKDQARWKTFFNTHESIHYYYPLFDHSYYDRTTSSWKTSNKRVGMQQIISFPRDILVTCNEGYQFAWTVWDDEDQMLYYINWTDTPTVLKANTRVTLGLKKADESNLEVAEIVNLFEKIPDSSDIIKIEEDKQLLLHNELLKEKWSTEINEIVKKVMKNRDNKTITISLITDTHHSSSYNAKNQIELLKIISEKVNSRAILHLGDVINGYQDSVDANKEYLIDFWNNQENTFLPVLYSIGHHEMYGVGREAEYGEDDTAIERKDVLGICGQSNKYINLVHSSDGAGWYYDIDNLRIISLDSVSNTAVGFSDEQYEFLQNALITNQKVIVVSHVTPRHTTNANNRQVVYGGRVQTAIDNSTCDVLAYLHGHNHADNIYKDIDIKYPYISFCCALPSKVSSDTFCTDGDPQAYNRTKGTYSEFCFDIINIHMDTGEIKMFRFGVGNDRTYTPNNG